MSDAWQWLLLWTWWLIYDWFTKPPEAPIFDGVALEDMTPDMRKMQLRWGIKNPAKLEAHNSRRYREWRRTSQRSLSLSGR